MSESIKQMSDFQPTSEFLERTKRLDAAMHLRKPDRVPVAPLCLHFYATKVRGISNKDAMYQQSKRFQALKEENEVWIVIRVEITNRSSRKQDSSPQMNQKEPPKIIGFHIISKSSNFKF